MAHYVITEKGKDTVVKSYGDADDAVRQYVYDNDPAYYHADLPEAVSVRPATVREALVAEYGEDWESHHVLDVGEIRSYPRRTVITEVVCLRNIKGYDIFGYDDPMEVSNYRVLNERWKDLEGWNSGPWSNCKVVALELDSEAPEDLTDVIDQLAEYPVLDEDDDDWSWSA